jgi:osmotically-inducible protein OsmY
MVMASLAGAVIAPGLAAATLAQDQGPATKAGQKLDEVGRSLKRGLQDAGESLRSQFARARESVHNMGIESRVYGRLHWDKLLADAALDIQNQNGVVILRGTVANAKAKARALELAKETVGVIQVVDQLAGEAPAKSAPATLSDATTKS